MELPQFSQEQLLEQLFLSRTQELLTRISKDHQLNVEDLKKKYLSFEILEEKKTLQEPVKKQEEPPKIEEKKKGRGRPKGSTKKKTNELEKVKLSENAIENFLFDFMKEGDNITLTKAKKEMEKTLSVSKENYSLELFSELFHKIEKKIKSLKENHAEEEVEEEQICCVEMEYEGQTYLLDKTTNKVYHRDSPHDFVGKLEKETINFEAEDSDVELEKD